MAKQLDLETNRKSLDQICRVPDEIISVYSLDSHVWDDNHSADAKRRRRPELKTISEFQLDPVRPFFMDILRNMAAPYNPGNKANPIGQGYWIQAEFGSGKSHVMCCLAALALGDEAAWRIVEEKEKKAERGRRESLYRFWEEGLQAKSGGGSKGIFVVVKTLVGSGGGVVGQEEKGARLVEYILDAAKEQLETEAGKNLSLYPAEILADRFITEDLERYRRDLKAFFEDPRFFEPDEAPESVDQFIQSIQSNKSPEYKRDCGEKLWRFYTEYLKVKPHIEAETEEILKHMVEAILAEGYSGVLLLLDEVSLFMKDRDDDQRTDDEKTLVVLSNRLAKTHNLPIWTVCSAQQKIEGQLGAKNIIADDRLKLVELLKEEDDYYNIVLNRVRTITDESAILPYFLYYKRGFTWPNSVGEKEFARFFPFHRPALEVIKSITYELTTARSAIHFMHQTLKDQIKAKGNELIRLWEMFDEAMEYEEDPSGVRAAISAVRTKRDTEYRIYEKCRNHIDGVTKGHLKVYRDKAVRTLQTLFLYYLARLRTEGLLPEEISNAVLIERGEDSSPDENIQHYETLADNLKRLLPQVQVSHDEDGRAHYRFEAVLTDGPVPADEFQKARDLAEASQQMRAEAWQHLLALDEWPIRARQLTFDLAADIRSMFRDVSRFVGLWEDAGSAKHGDQQVDINWRGRIVSGTVRMRDLEDIASHDRQLPAIGTADTDQDYSFIISERPVSEQAIDKLLAAAQDPRVILWVPDELTADEKQRLIDFAAYRKLVEDWQGKDSEDALMMVNWVADELKKNLAKIKMVVDSSYGRGRIDAANNRKMEPHVAGELSGVIAEPIDRVLTGVYESRDITFDVPSPFRNEEAVKVINGIVRLGEVPKGKVNKDTSAVQNYAVGLRIVRKSAERLLDVSDNPYVDALLSFIEDKLPEDGQSMPIDTVYRNFMGIGGPKDFGLTRRMVQLYLLCLVRSGHLRLQLGPKSGLAIASLDYSNIADVEFSAKVLESITVVQRMAKPEHWEVLRPYAAVLLGTDIPASADDAAIQKARASLRDLFEAERPTAEQTVLAATALFDELGVANPYGLELGQFRSLFAEDIESGNDIDRTLYALQNAFDYSAFESEMALQSEVDDLANRLRNYRDMQGFLAASEWLRAARAYCDHTMPEGNTLKNVRRLQRVIVDKLANLQPYIDDELKRRTELVGHIPPQPGATDTIGGLISEYTSIYCVVHENVVDTVGQADDSIAAIMEGDGMAALQILEGISALQPPLSVELLAELQESRNVLFHCPHPSKGQVEADLKRRPFHEECRLDLGDADRCTTAAATIATQAQQTFATQVERRMQVFLTEAIRERLQQGASEAVIASLLACRTGAEVWTCLRDAVAADATVVAVINRYLKKIHIKKVRLSEFQPTQSTVEAEQIESVVGEFRQFLQGQLDQTDGGALPMLQLE